ncbi:hypothetical protein niasHT_039161 [Heterodera trifolii]|uniref:Uncharacterized protein n=1 Tax=Heterodera trifolii TaxID=157864 RepID=A0ABD2IK68_9BILA
MNEEDKVICASNHEMYHVGVAWYHPNGEEVINVSVTVPAVNKRNGVTYSKVRRLYSRRQMLAKLATKVAGRVGKNVFLGKKGKCSSAVDYKQAQYIAQLIGAADLAQKRFLSFTEIHEHLGPPMEEGEQG